jgi:hypothetical protein
MSDNSLREENAQLRAVLTDMLVDMRHSPHPEILKGLEEIVATHKSRRDALSKGEAKRLGTIIKAMRLVMTPAPDGYWWVIREDADGNEVSRTLEPWPTPPTA